MTDDLVKRLREVKDWWREPGRTAEQAADRIEELTEALATLYWGVAEYGAPDEKLEQAHAALKGTKYD